MVAIPLFPTLLISRTWIEATSNGLVIQNPYRTTEYSWEQIEELTLEWHTFSQIGHIHLSSGDDAWVYAIDGGNKLSQRMAQNAVETLKLVRSYRPQK